MKILVTVTTGFLGNSVAVKLSADFLVDSVSRNEVINSKSISGTCYVSELIEFDKYMEYDFIIHCAGARPNSFLSQREANMVNVDITSEIVSKMKDDSLIILMSSQAVYGVEGIEVTEMCEPKPVSIYGKSKMLAESVVKVNENPYVILRLARLIGKGIYQNSDNIITTVFPKKIREEEEINIYGNADKKISLMDVDEVSIFIKHLIHNKMFWNETYNLAPLHKTSVVEVINELSEIATNLGYKPNISFDYEKSNSELTLSVTKALRTGWTPIKSLKESLEEILTK